MHSHPQAARKPENINLAWITLVFLENISYLVGQENSRLPAFIETNLKQAAWGRSVWKNQGSLEDTRNTG